MLHQHTHTHTHTHTHRKDSRVVTFYRGGEEGADQVYEISECHVDTQNINMHTCVFCDWHILLKPKKMAANLMLKFHILPR